MKNIFYYIVLAICAILLISAACVPFVISIYLATQISEWWFILTAVLLIAELAIMFYLEDRL